MSIYEALASLCVPVTHVPYRGKDDRYITFQSIGQRDTLYADGSEAETSEEFAVNVYMKKYDKAFVSSVKHSLEAAGYIASYDVEIYEQEVDRVRKVIMAITIGGNNG